MKIQLIILCVFLSAVLAEDSADKKLKLLCQNKSVDLTRSSEVKAIIEVLKANPAEAGCSEEVKESILALSPVLDVDSEAVCSMNKVEQLRDYHFRYISTVDETEGRSAIPKSLKHFVIGFGLTVSKQCKKIMINSLLLDSKQVSEEDYKVLEPWYSGEDGLIRDIGGGPADFDDLLSIRNLLKTTSDRDNEKVFVHSASGEILARVQSVCARKFKPFYEKLILPLVELSNFGYNFQGEELQRELAELTTNQQVQLWYKITFLCESLSDIDLIQEPRDIIKTEGINRKLVRVLTKEEAEEFKRNGGISLTESYNQSGDAIVYDRENGNPIEDIIIDHSDKDMERMINGFDSHVTETDKTRVKLFQKFGNFIKQILLKGKISLASSIFNSLGKQSEQTEEGVSNTDLVKVIDDYVAQVSDRSEDNPVGISFASYGKRVYHHSRFLGFKGVAKRAGSRFSLGLPKGFFSTSLTVILCLLAVVISVCAFG